jgi:hypothetical protein
MPVPQELRILGLYNLAAHQFRQFCFVQSRKDEESLFTLIWIIWEKSQEIQFHRKNTIDQKFASPYY